MNHFKSTVLKPTSMHAHTLASHVISCNPQFNSLVNPHSRKPQKWLFKLFIVVQVV